MRERNDPKNRVITGSNHQYEWEAWDFKDVDSSAGVGYITIKVFRKVPHYPIDYVDFVLVGHNPSGTVGDFAGNGRVHLVCP